MCGSAWRRYGKGVNPADNKVIFSLVLATLGRTQELREFFASLDRQTCRDFEVILIDQNQDDRLRPILEEFDTAFPLRHIRSTVHNLSHARNQGLPLLRGAIVGFPDDDCTYSPTTLEQVRRHFDATPTLGLVSGPATSPQGGFGSGRWTPRSSPLTLDNVWTSTISFTLFIRRTAVEAVGGFDEELGIGSRFGSGEETDYAIRVLRAGYTGHYDTSLRVTHPDKELTPLAAQRAYDYGLGMGRVLRKHAMAPRVSLPYFIRPIGGIFLSLISLRKLRLTYYWRCLRGRIAGYLTDSAAD